MSSYDFTAGLEDELDDISGGRAQWQAVLEAFWRDFKPKTAEVMEQKPSEVTAALDEFLSPYAVPPKGDGIRSAPVPDVRQTGGFPCAAGASAHSSPAPTIPSASSPASSPAGRGGRGRGQRAGS
jgi:hypothetical protein